MDLIEKNGITVNRHPWEISRANNLLSILKNKFFQGPYADIGAGDLYFANRLKTALNADIDAVDEAYKTRAPENPLKICIHSDISQLQELSYGTVLLLDVMEHVEQDSAFLEQVSKLLRPGGKLLLTVPAHQFLFSEHDIFLKHKRRYSMRALSKTLRNAGFEIEVIFYFYAALYLGRVLEVLLSLMGFKAYSTKAVSSWKRPGSSPLTKLIVFVLDMDFSVCRFLANINIFVPGLSLCATCKKTSL